MKTRTDFRKILTISHLFFYWSLHLWKAPLDLATIAWKRKKIVVNSTFSNKSKLETHRRTSHKTSIFTCHLDEIMLNALQFQLIKSLLVINKLILTAACSMLSDFHNHYRLRLLAISNMASSMVLYDVTFHCIVGMRCPWIRGFALFLYFHFSLNDSPRLLQGLYEGEHAQSLSPGHLCFCRN
jgi:hypothetical protein